MLARWMGVAVWDLEAHPNHREDGLMCMEADNARLAAAQRKREK